MAYRLNGLSATPYINGSKATVRLNGNIVYQPEPTRQWEYIGTSSSSYNGTYNAGGFIGGCLSSSAMLNTITNRLDPSDYRVGYVLRVTHYTYYDLGGGMYSPPTDCTTYYYQIVLR